MASVAAPSIAVWRYHVADGLLHHPTGKSAAQGKRMPFLGSSLVRSLASFLLRSFSRLRHGFVSRSSIGQFLEVRSKFDCAKVRASPVLQMVVFSLFVLCSFSHFPLTSLHLMRCFISPQQGAIMLRVEVMPGRGLGWGASVKKPHPRFFSF